MAPPPLTKQQKESAGAINSLVFNSVNFLPTFAEKEKAWYGEVSPIVEEAFSRRTLLTPFEISTSPPPSFIIDNPEDATKTLQLREFFEKRVEEHRRLFGEIVNNETEMTQKLMQRLCIGDLDKRRIKELEEELKKANNCIMDFSAKNESLNQQLANMFCVEGADTGEGTTSLKPESGHRRKSSESRFASLRKQFGESSGSKTFRPPPSHYSTVRHQPLHISSADYAFNGNKLSKTTTVGSGSTFSASFSTAASDMEVSPPIPHAESTEMDESEPIGPIDLCGIKQMFEVTDGVNSGHVSQLARQFQGRRSKSMNMLGYRVVRHSGKGSTKH